MVDRELRFPKDVHIHDVILITHEGQPIDIFNVFVEINVYEDLFANSLSGDIVLDDATDLPTNVPLSGQEKIVLSFRTPGDDQGISVVMNIYKISERIHDHNKRQTYTLHFVSPETYANQTTKLSRAFSGKISQTVQQILQNPENGLETQKPVNIEPSQNQFNVVVPRWTPFETINWLATRTISAETNNPNYVLFETVDQWNFVSLTSLISEQPVVGYSYGPAQHNNVERKGNYMEEQLARNMFMFETYNVEYMFNMLNEIAMGMYASRIIVHDMTNDITTENTFNYLEHFDQVHPKEFGQGPLMQETPNLDDTQIHLKPDSNIHVVPDSLQMFDNIQDNKKYDQWLLQRQSEIKQYNTIKIQATVPGDSRRRVGEVVEVILPSQQRFDEDEFLKDEFLSGKYIITSIRHQVTENNYQLVLELSKNCLDKSLPEQ